MCWPPSQIIGGGGGGGGGAAPPPLPLPTPMEKVERDRYIIDRRKRQPAFRTCCKHSRPLPYHLFPVISVLR